MSLKSVRGFFGDYRWLSNFWPATVELDGVEYTSVEHAYQAAKTTNSAQRFIVRKAVTAAEAKRLSKRGLITLRPGWEDMKVEVLGRLVEQKFTRSEELGRKLLATDDAELVEENSWGDVFWGVCRGVGRNELGKILMRVREGLRAESAITVP